MTYQITYQTPCFYHLRLVGKLKSLDMKGKLNLSLIEQAINWARHYHSGSLRKSGEPYYTHPLEVAYIACDYNLTTNVIVTSILHDIVEDTEVTIGMIESAFGTRVACMVDMLTRDRPDGTKLTIEEVLNNSYQEKDREVLLIKLLDRLHNIKTLKAVSPEKIIKTAKETLNFFMAIAMYMGYTDLEKTIYELCCDNLAIDSSFDVDFQFSECRSSYLDALETSYSYQTVSQVLQNVTNQVKNKE